VHPIRELSLVVLGQDLETVVAEPLEPAAVVQPFELEGNIEGQHLGSEGLEAEVVAALDIDLEVAGYAVFLEDLGEAAGLHLDRHHSSAGYALRNETVETSTARDGPEKRRPGLFGDADSEESQLTRCDLAFESTATGLDQDRVSLDRYHPKSAMQVVLRVKSAVETDVVDELRIDRS
jgi:hypothetical protein